MGIVASRRAEEERWRARVRAAKRRFDLAVAEADRASREPDAANVEMTQAMEEHARQEYLRELQIFTDLIVRGKMPGDETTE
jgi:hypothetical protein